MAGARQQAVTDPLLRQVLPLGEELAAPPVPIVLPERIDERRLDGWSTLDTNRVVVVHANHANEIDDTARKP